LESARTIDLETFVPRDSIGWIWLDQPHHVVPADKPGEEAFAVIREAMRDAGVVGVARVVLHRRERAVMVEPRARASSSGRCASATRCAPPSPFPRRRGGDARPAALRLVRKLIAAGTRPWSPDMVRDPVQEKLLEIIAAKKKPARRLPAAGPEEGANVVSIMDALRKAWRTRRDRRASPPEEPIQVARPREPCKRSHDATEDKPLIFIVFQERSHVSRAARSCRLGDPRVRFLSTSIACRCC
jgi:DNA end-binding protein Ku